jgi:hypothetical protein
MIWSLGFLLLSFWFRNLTSAFTVPITRTSQSASSSWQLYGEGGNDPTAGLSEERKTNLFQCLLRDLEVEGVPLLGCDADQAHVLQAALWTTMAELSEKDEAEKACLVLESIPVDALRTFVDDFVVLKTQNRLMDNLPELQRISVSLVGKGVGPAILIESAARSPEESTAYRKMQEENTNTDENKSTAAMKSFVDRMVAGLEMCPYTKDNKVAPSGLEAHGVKPGPVGYRMTRSTDTCDVLSAFWNCVCEMLSTPDEQISSTILSLPAIGTDSTPTQAHNRFSSVAELVSRSLFLYRGEDVFELQHNHPLYDRNLVFPVDKPAHGHLPPTGWLRPMLKSNGNQDEADTFTDEQLELQNYQRRSPLQAVTIKRVSQLNAAMTQENDIMDLDLGDGRVEKASGVATYSRNIIRLVGEGKETLQTALDAEIAITA